MIRLKTLLSEAKTARFYVRHPLDVTKAIRVLKGAGISILTGINNVIQIPSSDVEKAIEILTHHKVDFEPTKKRLKEKVSDRWGNEDLFDYPIDKKTGKIAHGTPEMAKKLKSLYAKSPKHGMPTVKNGKIVCSTCGKEYISYKTGAVHPGTPAAKYLYQKGIIKRWK